MQNKRGWIRILEATIAVLLVSSTLVIVYTRQPDRVVDASEYVYLLQKELLSDISLRDDLRSYVLTSTEDQVDSRLHMFVSSKVPATIGARIKVCDLTDPPSPCKLNSTDLAATGESDVFVEETVLSSNITNYDPKKVRIFIWEHPL